MQESYNLLEIFQQLQNGQPVTEEDLIVKRDMYFYPIKVTATHNESGASNSMYIYLHACKSDDNKYHMECNPSSIEEYNELVDDLTDTQAHENDRIMYFVPSYSNPTENQ